MREEGKEKTRAERENKRRVKRERKAEKARRRAQASAAALRRATELREKRNRIKKKVLSAMRCGKYAFSYENRGFLARVGLVISGDGMYAVTLFSAAGIAVEDVVRAGKNTEVKIRKKDLRKAIAILDELCYTYKLGAVYGVPRLCAFWLARLGIILGIAFALLALNISYSYIWRIDIAGNDKLSRERIQSAIAPSGITVGAKKRALSLREVSAAVSRLDGVVDASAEIEGTTLKINVLEATEHTVHTSFGAYKSEYDATVTRTVVRSGRALVKPGDLVKRGDILADGEVYSTTGELLFVGDCDCEVYGNVSVSYSFYLSQTVVEYMRTGQSQSRTALTVFGVTLFEPQPPYDLYEMTASTAHYDLLIPLYVTTYEYFETAPVEVERDMDEAAKSFAAQKAAELEFSGAQLKSSYTVKPSTSGLYAVHIFLSGEALISRGFSPPQTHG